MHINQLLYLLIDFDILGQKIINRKFLIAEASCSNPKIQASEEIDRKFVVTVLMLIYVSEHRGAREH